MTTDPDMELNRAMLAATILTMATRNETRVERVRAELALRLIDGLLSRLRAGEGFMIEMPGRRTRDTIHVRVEVVDTGLGFFGQRVKRPPARRRQSP